MEIIKQAGRYSQRDGIEIYKQKEQKKSVVSKSEGMEW